MRKAIYVLAIATLLVGLFATKANADHAWGNYHWGRTANPFTLKLGDNLSGVWDSYLATTSNDWNLSSVLDTTMVSGRTNPRKCGPTVGRAEVCNYKYGQNGWLGVASIWINSSSHITKGTVKLNDTYFNTSTYNTAAWRNLVMCQEVGHIFGLDHQDENFNNAPLGSCLDYSNDPNPNQHPNQHDYDLLEEIYTHLDSTSTVNQSLVSSPFRGFVPPAPLSINIDLDNPRDWGKEIRKSVDRRSSLFVRELGRGEKVFTFVFWADPEESSHSR